MKVLVTGGAGFIGSRVVKTILEKTSWDVVTIDKLTYAGSLSTLGDDVLSNPRHTFVQMDISNRDELAHVFLEHQPMSVMNLAAESHVDNSIDGPHNFIKTNILGTYSILEEARKYWEQGGRQHGFRFLQISTDEVFGSLDNDEPSFSEHSPYRPNSPYSATKASADHLVRAWGKTYHLPVLTTYCTNNYGPFQHPEKFIPVIITSCLSEREIPIYGDGQNIRSWIYVNDHVDALLTVLTKGNAGESYSIGGNKEISNVDMVCIICDYLDKEKPRAQGSYRDLITFVTDRPGHDYRYSMNDAKLRESLAWRHGYTFEKGIQETMAWYLSNQPWNTTMLSKKQKALQLW